VTRDLRTDVLVVGAGISGALAADVLSEAGLRVVVVDRRGPMRGSTAASTALLQYELDVPLSWLSDRIGRAKAERFWRRSKLAVDALRERARRLGIRAQQRDRSSLYLSGNRLDRDGLLQELAARRHAGFDTRFLGSREVKRRFGIRGRTALLDDGNFEAEPRRLAAGFLNAALARGATLRSPVEVSDVSPGQRGVRAATKGGPVIRCRHLVFATGYEIPKGIPRGGHDIRSTWAIATKPQPRAVWEGAAMIWEASEPYLYLRTTCDGRIICGGEDEGFKDEKRRDALLAAKTATLATKLKALLPRVDPTPEFAWCGSFGASPDGMPTIGCIPRMAHCYAVMGYGGNGITFAMMAAQMLRGLITGSGDSDLDLVAFRRRASPLQVFS
jgi:glycine/D-amino acid oxidase-like deaminating enzyme